jgi:uncharacterized membrane protein SirB2
MMSLVDVCHISASSGAHLCQQKMFCILCHIVYEGCIVSYMRGVSYQTCFISFVISCLVDLREGLIDDAFMAHVAYKQGA